jgi:hypothetical protein
VPHELWYTALETFDTHHQGWQNYIQWCGLTQLEEVISLDYMLCPKAITASVFIEEDWLYNVHQDHYIDYFRDANHLIKLANGLENVNILAVMRMPQTEVNSVLKDERFLFCGYDLVEDLSGISALTNCGGFPLSFDNGELSKHGLI